MAYSARLVIRGLIWRSNSDASLLLIHCRYIMRRNVSGFYGYATFEHPESWPGFEIGQVRAVYKLDGQR